MASVFDVAKYILQAKGEMSTWKLQKLCYYAQAWHYTWTERPLFPEKFEAWRNGPVCPKLFYAHQGKYMVDADDIDGNPENITADEKESIDAIIEDYGKMEPYDLRELTHFEDPWKNARGGIPDSYACHNEITLESMGLYYGGL